MIRSSKDIKLTKIVTRKKKKSYIVFGFLIRSNGWEIIGGVEEWDLIRVCLLVLCGGEAKSGLYLICHYVRTRGSISEKEKWDIVLLNKVLFILFLSVKFNIILFPDFFFSFLLLALKQFLFMFLSCCFYLLTISVLEFQ